VPLVYGATAWGLNAMLPSWGYSYAYTYSNPYYVAPATTAAYDYSQPIVINNYVSPTAEATADATSDPTVQDTPAAEAGYKLFDQSLQAFKQGDYTNALRLDEAAIQSVPDDPVLHEFGALCLFAQGNYSRSAAVLNALLAVAPGMDWTTMSGLYPDVETYTKQLRALEAYSKQKPDDAASHFVLAYHYLVAGHSDASVRQLKEVVRLQPEDQVAQKMLSALQPAEQQVAEAAEPPALTESKPEAAPESRETTDLVGNWRAVRDGDVFELTIGEEGQFTWKATPKGSDPVSLSGQTATTADTLILESGDQGTMVARVKSGGPDKFQFVATGSPPNDPGLTFERVNG